MRGPEKLGLTVLATGVDGFAVDGKQRLNVIDSVFADELGAIEVEDHGFQGVWLRVYEASDCSAARQWVATSFSLGIATCQESEFRKPTNKYE